MFKHQLYVHHLPTTHYRQYILEVNGMDLGIRSGIQVLAPQFQTVWPWASPCASLASVPPPVKWAKL